MKTKTKKCPKCRAPMELRRVEHPYWHNSALIALIRDVPAWVCLLCNHHHIEPPVEVTLRYIVKDYMKIGTLFPIPTTTYRVQG
ncbi:MAG TPA: YgiT-type zinc finger protein [Elusimicrobiota bacterium]|nr:YgiT-type zinc finger protein [Elusimicrobiota bacterium]